MSTRLVWSVIGTALAVSVVAVAILFWRGGRSAPTVDTPPPADVHATIGDDDTVPFAPDEVSSGSGSATPAPGRVPSLEDLKRLCIDPWSGLDYGCAEALDRRYRGEPVGLAGLHNGPSEWNRSAAPPAYEGIPWEVVFADPLSTRATAQAALSRAECRVSRPETRPDLGSACAVNEIAILAMLQTACVMELVYYKPGFNPWGSPDDLPGREKRAAEMETKWWQYEALDDEISLSMEEYYRRRAEIDDARFRFAWRLSRCKAVPEDALAWVDELPTPEPGGHQGQDLTEMAARLGSEWAIQELKQSKQLLDAERHERFERWKRRQGESQGREHRRPAEPR